MDYNSYNPILYYSLLMSQIIFLRPDACLKNEGLMGLFYLLKYSPQFHQQSILAIILSYAYVQLDAFLKFLRENLICRAYLIKVLRLEMKEKFFIKIFNMVFIKLIQTENQNFFGAKTLARCIYYLQDIAVRKGRKSHKNFNNYHFSNGSNKEETLGGHLKGFLHPLSNCNEL